MTDLDTLRARFERSAAVPDRFFAVEAPAVARACQAAARRFLQGGRLLVFGEGAEASDAQHVAVEFVHPVIVGKRALPALALTADTAALTGASRGGPVAFAPILAALGHPADIALGISRGAPGPAVREGLAAARARGLLTIALAGGAADRDAADFVFVVPGDDPLVVQEVQETLYHVLWELVHVFVEHEQAGAEPGGEAPGG
ncbi:MAG TPA: SIS domain-containing protein [Vicinamibacterales bacterium]|nr:SIS domain-containing protein [Vicinamibacterales bacterium]